MSAEIIGIIGLAALLILMFGGLWIGFAMGVVGLVGLFFIMGFENAIEAVSTISYTRAAFYPMSALPLFTLMGVIVGVAAIGNDLYDTAYKWLGRLPGGLAISTIFASGAFAAITGSSSASIVTFGSVAMPEMKKYKYSETLAAGVIAAGGTIGILIPPSLGFILYAILTEESIGRLFMAGIIPGIMEVLFYTAVVLIICGVNPLAGPRGPKTSIADKIRSLKPTWPTLALFLLVMGGIYGGIFTPTEAGAIGTFGSIIIVTAMRRMNVGKFTQALLESVKINGMIYVLVIGAFMFAHFLAMTKLPFFLSDLVVTSSPNHYIVLAVIIFLYIILGMFLDIFSCIVLTIPIFFPTIQAFGFDTVWFGVIMVRVMEIGLITPPIGMNVFMLSGVSKLPLNTVFKGILPFFAADIVHVAVLIAFPFFSLWLPQTMFS